MTRFPSPSPLLPEILELHGRWRRGREAVRCGAESLDWPAFCAANHRFAHGLLARGIMPGDRVGIFMNNGLAMVQAIFGTLASGAVSVPLNTSVSDDAIVAMLADAGVRALAVSDGWRARFDALRPRLPASLALWLVDAEPSPGWEGFAGFCEGQRASIPPAALTLTPEAPLNIIYSSGTTGLPKGILQTHGGRRDWAYDLAIALRYHGAARCLVTIGLYSNISWVAMLATLLAGGTLVIHERFDAAAFLDAVERERVTHTAMVPIQFQRVIDLQRERPRDLSSMTAMMSCGSPLREGLKRSIFEHFPCGIIELYGLTEGIITTLDPEDAEGRWDSVGRPLIGTDIRIIDEQGTVCEQGSPGEIVSRGRITMPGYWNREDASLEAAWDDDTGQRWIRTGDIGYLDADGFLYIVDRKKDMILSGGQNVYPQDIEALLVAHEDVLDVGVIGARSGRWGETPIALVVPGRPDADAGAILAWANGRLGRQQRLADLLFVDELPRNPNGKMLKRELRDRYGDRSYG